VRLWSSRLFPSIDGRHSRLGFTVDRDRGFDVEPSFLVHAPARRDLTRSPVGIHGRFTDHERVSFPRGSREHDDLFAWMRGEHVPALAAVKFVAEGVSVPALGVVASHERHALVVQPLPCPAEDSGDTTTHVPVRFGFCCASVAGSDRVATSVIKISVVMAGEDTSNGDCRRAICAR
jgi:hypothetical protein